MAGLEIVDRMEVPTDVRHVPEHMARMSERLAEVRTSGKRWKPGAGARSPRGAAIATWNREHPRPRTKDPRSEYEGEDAVMIPCPDCGKPFRCHPAAAKRARCPDCALERLRKWRPRKD